MAVGRPACWVLTRGEPLAGSVSNLQGMDHRPCRGLLRSGKRAEQLWGPGPRLIALRHRGKHGDAMIKDGPTPAEQCA